MSNSDNRSAHLRLSNSDNRWEVGGRTLPKEINLQIEICYDLLIASTSDLICAAGGDCSSFRERMLEIRKNPDILSYILELKNCRDTLRSTTEDVHSFLAECASNWVLYPILSVVVEYTLSPSVFSFQIIHHYTNFLQKMSIPREDLVVMAISSYLENENRLKEFVYDDDTMCCLKDIISGWLKNFSITEAPRHSSGSTADAGSSLIAKERSLWFDELMVHCLPNFFEIGERVSSPFYRVSKTIFVPKTAFSVRTISMEPASLQFWQQPIFLAFDNCFHRDLSEHISLDDQDRSRSLTIQASKTGEYATIDLSMASDSISLHLVERVFPWAVLQPLVATRSTHTELEGIIIPLAKFSPMGSSVNFPIESLIFAAVCELVAIRHSYTKEQRKDAFVVYGDDIIIRTDLVSDLIVVLESIGFLVNREKSFSSGLFRESCGVYAYNGIDISTPSIPRDFRAKPAPLTDNWMTCMIDLSNRLLLAGMLSARRVVLSTLPTQKMVFRQFRPEFLQVRVEVFSSLYSQNGIWSFCPQNNQLKTRKPPPIKREKKTMPAIFSTPLLPLLTGPTAKDTISCGPDFQRPQVYTLVGRTEQRREKVKENDEVYRLRLWLRIAASNPGRSRALTIPVGESPRRRLRMAWITIPQ